MPSTRRFALTLALLWGGCAIGESPRTTAADPVIAPDSAKPSVIGAAYLPSGVRSPVKHTVDVDGHPITVWSKQPPNPGASIVLVHGRTWSALPDFDLQVAGSSRSLMDALVAEGLVVYAIDLRGYGGTPRDASQWLTPNRAAADLNGVLDWVAKRDGPGPAPAVLGWSLGALVAQLAAQQNPSRLSSLILYGYPRRPGTRYPADPTPLPPPKKEPTTAKAAAEDFTIPGAIPQPAIDAFVAAALAADPVRVDWRASEQWNTLEPAQLKIPTLVIHGERDPYAPLREQSALFTRLGAPDRQWVIVPGGDHAAHLEDCAPHLVHAVISFLWQPS